MTADATVRNVLFVMCDQLRADHLSCYGGPVPTPNLDALAARGVRFERAYVNSGVCGPSRTSYYTGRYPVSHRVTWNRVPLPLDERSLGQYLAAAHLPLHLLGKTHVVPDLAGARALGYNMNTADALLFDEGGFTPIERYDGHVEPPLDSPYRTYLLERGYRSERPWTDFVIGSDGLDGTFASGWLLRNATLPARVRAEDSESAYLTTRAIDYVRTMGERPWALHLSYIKPHWPFKAPPPYHAMYTAADCVVPVRAQAEREREHPVYAAYRGLEESVTFARDDVWRSIRPVSMGLVKQIDDELGRLYTALDALGRLADTLILFTSDHGDLAGDHWLGEKEYFYESVMRVPLIVVDPSSAADATRGSSQRAFAESVDIVPTVLDALGLPVPDHRVEGRSLIRLLRDGDAAPDRDAVFGFLDYAYREARQFLKRGPERCTGLMVRTDRYKFIDWDGFEPQLFDLAEDPGELVDRGPDPACAGIRAECGTLLFDWLRSRKRRTTESGDQVAARTNAHSRMMGIEIGKW
jgi:arylsulfatase A-like enzyme